MWLKTFSIQCAVNTETNLTQHRIRKNLIVHYHRVSKESVDLHKGLRLYADDHIICLQSAGGVDISSGEFLPLNKNNNNCPDKHIFGIFLDNYITCQ